MAEKKPTERRSWMITFVVAASILALLVAAYSVGFNRGRGKAGTESARTAGQSPKKPQRDQGAPSEAGKQAFAQGCGSCHTLSAADTTGAVGPNLDQLKPDRARVVAAIKNGGTGTGAMPPNLITGKEAEEVADFVAAAVGR